MSRSDRDHRDRDYERAQQEGVSKSRQDDGASATRITKKVRQGVVEIDYEESTLVVNYEVEKVSMDENNRVVEVLGSKTEVRRVKLKQLSVDKNMAQLAADIVEKCSYIHPSRTEEVEQLLIKLRKYQLSASDSAPAAARDRTEVPRRDRDSRSSDGNARSSRDRDQERALQEVASKSRQAEQGAASVKTTLETSTSNTAREDELVRKRRRQEREAEEVLPAAHIDDIDDYLDMLYQVGGNSEAAKAESLRIQVRGTGMILKLCRDVMNLEVLIQNTTVMGALTRVLAEEFKKSTELTFNILRIFLSFSNFMEMHGLLAEGRVGFLTLKAIEYEVRRWDSKSEEKEEKEMKYKTIIERARETGDEAAGQDRVQKLRENERVKQRVQHKKQEKMLFVAFYLLINLAEDVGVERKMMNKDLLAYLSSTLDRAHGDLLILTVTFLKKLSIYSENKEIIIKSDVVRKLGRFIPCSSQPLVQATLQLLFNLSFDATLRKQMLESPGLVAKLVGLLQTAPYRQKTLKVLYHLSVSDDCKIAISNSGGMPYLMSLAVNFPNPILAAELAALLINLSHTSKNVEQMVSNRGLNLLMDRLDNDYAERDQGLMKIIRNVSYYTFMVQQQHEGRAEDYKYRGIWAPHFKLMLNVLTDTDNHDTLIELLGTLANMTTYDVPANTSWSKLCREYNLISLFSKMLIPGMAQNDLILEVIMLISSIANDANACIMIASSNLIGLLYQTWKDKSEDIEIKLQLIHCFHKLFLVDKSREEAMYSTRIVVDIMECLSDPSAAVRACADEVTELALEYDRLENGDLGALGLRIRKKRFEGFNNKWLTQFDMLNGDPGHVGNFNGSLNTSNYDDDDMEESDDLEGVAHGSMEWKMLMRQKERLALDMSDLDAAVNYNGVQHGRQHILNDDLPSSGEGDGEWDESGQDWS